MKKTLIALAVGAAFAAPAAFADVTLSGAINVGPTIIHQGDGSTNESNSIRSTGPQAVQGVTHTGINNNYSNITIGSMEDLGGGLKLDFAFQIIAPIGSNPSNSPGASGTNTETINRNSHIGLVSDSWGGVWVGTNEQLYERYLYSVDPLDGAAGLGGNLQMMGSPGYGSVFDSAQNNNPIPGGHGQADFYRRTDQSIWYDSPNWNGFTFGVYTSLQPSKTNLPGGGTVSPTVYGGGLKYVSPQIPIQAWAAYEHHKDLFGLNVIAPTQVGTNSSDHGIQVGAGYTLGDIFFYLTYEQLKYSSDGLAAGVNEYKRNAENIGVKWNIPTGYVGAEIMLAQNGTCNLVSGASCDAGNTGGKIFSVGYYHTLSKQTQAYIMADYNKNDSLQYYGVAGGTGGVNNAFGATIWGATIGLKHTF